MQSPRTEAQFADARKATIVIVPEVVRSRASTAFAQRGLWPAPRCGALMSAALLAARLRHNYQK